ncbi:hypothetical protein LK08_29945 [Streptomyces sp. MUSC 125]|nr:hypothetical protein LK08_29945 [Streptomyces sp. MUSC 125]
MLKVMSCCFTAVVRALRSVACIRRTVAVFRFPSLTSASSLSTCEGRRSRRRMRPRCGTR